MEAPFHPSQLGFTPRAKSALRYELLSDPTRPDRMRNGLYAMQAVGQWWEMGYLVEGVETSMYGVSVGETLTEFYTKCKDINHSNLPQHKRKHYEKLRALLNHTVRIKKLASLGI